MTGHLPTGADVAAMVDQRALLLEDHDRTHPEVVDATRRLHAVLSSGRTVRALDLRGSATDRALAEDLASREKVHPPDSTNHRDRRLAADRRVFVVEHPLLEKRPMNVLWVALCESTPDSLEAIIEPGVSEMDPRRADTAVFYSIWNAEAGLAGIGAGKDLIAGANALLQDELPNLTTLTTMSPIPGFRQWYEDTRHNERDGRNEQSDLARACARYLLHRRSDGRLYDPVARFHMGNGARVWRLLLDADRSERGMRRSFGVMVNYRYSPEDLQANADATKRGEPPLGESIEGLLARD